VRPSTASLGSGDNNRRCRKPRCRPNARRRLFRTTNVSKERPYKKPTPCLRFPENCSGAMYGSLPHSPVDIWTVLSQGNLYTVEAPKSPI